MADTRMIVTFRVPTKDDTTVGDVDPMFLRELQELAESFGYRVIGSINRAMT